MPKSNVGWDGLLSLTSQAASGLMRVRGMESHSPSGYAEAFHCQKLVVL